VVISGNQYSPDDGQVQCAPPSPPPLHVIALLPPPRSPDEGGHQAQSTAISICERSPDAARSLSFVIETKKAINGNQGTSPL
jgi:hypothetical protein